MRRDPAHPLALGFPVEQHGAVEEIRELLAAESRLLRERVGRVLAGHPGDVVVHQPRRRGPVRSLHGSHSLALDPGRRAGVVRSRDEDERVDVLDLVHDQRAQAWQAAPGTRCETQLSDEIANLSNETRSSA